jgi:thiamine pyrophosphokinase
MSGKVKGIKTKGLLYPLNDEELENGKRDGSSNEAISDTISIEYTSGSLLLMISKK